MTKNPLDISNDLITYFMKLYKEKYQTKTVINRGKLKFALADILQDWSQADVKSFIAYYIKTDSNADLSDFCRRYDEIIKDKALEEHDAKERRQLMSETQKSVKEFREKYKGAK